MKLVLINLIMSFSVFAINAKETQKVKWFRPVQETQAEYSVEVKNDSTRTVKVFAGEWFEVQDKSVGNIIIGKDTLLCDKAATTDYTKRDTLVEKYSRLPFKFMAHGDTVAILSEVEDTLKCLVINQSKNKLIDTILIPGSYVLSKGIDSATVLRLSPVGHIPTLQIVGEIHDYGVIHEEKEEIDEPKKESKANAILIIGGLIVLLLCACGLWVWNKNKSRSSNENPKDKEGKSDIVDEVNAIDLIEGGTKEKKEKRSDVKQLGEHVDVNEVANRADELNIEFANEEFENLTTEELISRLRTISDEKKRVEDELLEKKAELDIVNDELNRLRGSYKLADEDLNRTNLAKQQVEQQLDFMKRTNDKLENEIKIVKDEANIEITEVKKEAEKQIKKIKDDAQLRIDKSERAREEAKAKTLAISNELEAKFEKERESLNSKITNLTTELSTTESTLSTTRNTLANTERNLESSKTKISRLNKAQEKYQSVLTYVPFAHDYALYVCELLNIANQVNKAGIRLLDLNLDDPYHIMKFITRYTKTLSSIDMDTLVSELKMIEKGDLVLQGSNLSTYDQSKPKDALDSTTRQYFFASYLRKLVDALVVLNESLAGSNRIVDGVSARDVEVFKDFRDRITAICRQLGIVVENVKLFDKVGQKTDLRADLVDAGFALGDIIDMENAVVYLVGSHRPDIKIRVKVQE